MRFIGYVWSRSLLVCMIVLPCAAAAGKLPLSCYTNIAGQVISGPVQRIDGDKVVFRGRAFPLEIFPKGERGRILKAAGKVPLPPRNIRAERRNLFYQNLLNRQDALEKHGAISHEKAEAQRALIRRAWHRAG